MVELRQLSTAIGCAEGTQARERLLTRGAAALTTAELVSLCLRTGTRGVSALWLAQALLAELGSVSALLTAPASRLLSVPGLGPAKVATLLAAAALAAKVASSMAKLSIWHI